MKSYKQIKKQLLKDKGIKNSYNKLEPEFNLAEMIIKKRIQQGLSQEDLARKIGTKQPSIARLESGSYNPSIVFLRKTVKALNASLRIEII